MKTLAVSQLEDMVAQGCTMPGCTHTEHNEVFVVQRCHPGAGLNVSYTKGSGMLLIACKVCEAPVVQIGVALI
jgi:hypothetical protein